MIVRWMFVALFGFVALGAGAAAQDWPTKPVEIITGFAAGGIGDLGARLLADHITRTTGQQAVVENRTGAAGTHRHGRGRQGRARRPHARPRAQRQPGDQSVHAEVDAVRRAEGPDPGRRDRRRAADDRASSTEVPAKTFKEFQALAKEKPKTYTYGSAGVGSLPHLSAAEFARMAGIETGARAVPRQRAGDGRSARPAASISSRASIGTFRAGLDAGKLRILLTATKERLPYSPDVPTAAEAGLPGYLMSVWIGVVAPAGTPAAGDRRASMR